MHLPWNIGSVPGLLINSLSLMMVSISSPCSIENQSPWNWVGTTYWLLATIDKLIILHKDPSTCASSVSKFFFFVGG